MNHTVVNPRWLTVDHDCFPDSRHDLVRLAGCDGRSSLIVAVSSLGL